MRPLICLILASLPALSAGACSDDPAPAGETDAEIAPDIIQEAASDIIEEVAPDVAQELETSAPDAEIEPARCPPGAADCDTIQWAELDAFPHATDHHVTFMHTSAAGTYLYVAGGATSKQQELDIWDEVWRARVEASHLLGPWEAEAALPAPLAFQGLAQAAGAVYLLSGVTEDAQGAFSTNRGFIGRFDDDGHLAWTAAPSLPDRVRVHPTGHYLPGVGGQPDQVVVVGGSATAPLATVIYAPVQPDGALGAWATTAALPAPRSHQAGVVRDGRIWLFGGLTTGDAVVPEILRSTPTPDGGVAGWEVVATLDNPPWTEGASLYADGVFLVGGGQGGPGQERYIARVRFARWDAGGALGEFVDVEKALPVARSHVHQAPIFDGYIYSVGGRVMPSGDSIPRSFVGYLDF